MLPVLALAAVAFVVGIVVGASYVPGEQRVVQRFADAWRRGDYARMWAQLTADQQRTVSAGTLQQAYGIARDTGTVRSYSIGKPHKESGHTWSLPVVAHTRSFGDVSGRVVLPLEGSGDKARIRWTANLTFPGVPAGTRLERRTTLGARGTLLSRDNVPLAQSLGSYASSIFGDMGPIPSDQLAAYRAAGYPDDAQVGTTGLERIFERQLAGTPGGDLLAGGKVLAHAAPKPGATVRTTLSPSLQRTAVDALAGRLGGVLVMEPRTGQILAVAGIAFSGLQPPGSTFKMVTLSAVLQDGIARPSTTFPYATSAVLAGVPLGNANGESCGGTLVQAFATSCNSVFAPLGAKLGAHRLVAMAERFGFNQPPAIAGAATSSIPSADTLGDDLAVGSSAIGQGRVQATVLQMTSIAATIGLEGRRPEPTLLYSAGDRPRLGRRAISAHVAHLVRRMMVEVVRNGTGVAAAIPGVVVAGKTGTAELRSTQPCTPTADNPESCKNQQANPNDTTDTDAWFASFAPARDPKVAVGVLLVGAGAGGDTAAPVARTLLEAGLRRG
jgi:peptidoglycan glycosyltransferase